MRLELETNEIRIFHEGEFGALAINKSGVRIEIKNVLRCEEEQDFFTFYLVLPQKLIVMPIMRAIRDEKHSNTIAVNVPDFGWLDISDKERKSDALKAIFDALLNLDK